MGNADGNALPLEPFEQLLEYSTVVMWKSSLASITGMTARVPRAMPPWRVPPGVGETKDESLSQKPRPSFVPAHLLLRGGRESAWHCCRSGSGSPPTPGYCRPG